MKVVVVESPSKAKTINNYLGKDYTVLASYGHVRDLPSKNGSVDPDNHFQMTWEMDARSKKQMMDITSSVKKAEEVILATDPDREGEAISWHVLQVLKEKKALANKPVTRVVFHEITKTAIEKAIAQPRDLDEGLIQAYLARRALDYLVGFTLSPVLWRKLPGSRSAGRVQSVALRLITDREAEIEKFISEEYWSILGLFGSKTQQDFEAKLTHFDGKKLEKLAITNEAQAKATVAQIQTQTYSVAAVERKETKRHPTAPFITSTLQQEASRKLRFSAKKTMQVAQKLYEGIKLNGETVGLITYMRTDSTNVAQEAVQATRTFIQTTFGQSYLPAAPRLYTKKAKNAQEAHEAIRPTDVAKTPDAVKQYLDNDQLKLYDLIWKRMVACQMESARFNQLAIDVASADQTIIFRATGSTLLFDGFLKVYEEGRDDTTEEKEQRLPDVKQGEALALKDVTPHQHFTQPPPRYSEATLVKKLEELGIGRPSTYASILSTLMDRSYVRKDKGKLAPEPLGRIVTTFLVEYFKKYLEYDFTARLEEQLDEIADGKVNWEEALAAFWHDFKQAVDDASTLKITDVINYLNETLAPYLFAGAPNPEKPRACPECQDGELSLKLGKFGAFVGCSNYPECRHTRQLTAGAPTESGDGEAEAPLKKAAFEPKILGEDPESGLEVTMRKGPYGFYLQWGEAQGKTKPKRSPIPKGVNPDEVTLEQALVLGALPKTVGKHPETGEDIQIGQGRYGPYVKYRNKFTPVPKTMDLLKLNLEEAVQILSQAKK
jgi:DNA topoisomerase-1